MVIEVADSSLAYDRSTKRRLYAEAGIPEYWLADLRARRLEVRRGPVPMPDQPYGYGYREVLILDRSGSISPLAAPASRISVADLLP